MKQQITSDKNINNEKISPHQQDKKYLLPEKKEKIITRNFGSNKCFIFSKNEPLITIGPHCINNFVKEINFMI